MGKREKLKRPKISVLTDQGNQPNVSIITPNSRLHKTIAELFSPLQMGRIRSHLTQMSEAHNKLWGGKRNGCPTKPQHRQTRPSLQLLAQSRGIPPRQWQEAPRQMTVQPLLGKRASDPSQPLDKLDQASNETPPPTLETPSHSWHHPMQGSLVPWCRGRSHPHR